jgi:hypothetical protein
MRSSQAYHLTPMLDCVDRSLIADLACFTVLGRERARAQAPSPQPARLTDLTGAVFTSSAAERGRARSGLSLRDAHHKVRFLLPRPATCRNVGGLWLARAARDDTADYPAAPTRCGDDESGAWAPFTPTTLSAGPASGDGRTQLCPRAHHAAALYCDDR